MIVTSFVTRIRLQMLVQMRAVLVSLAYKTVCQTSIYTNLIFAIGREDTIYIWEQTNAAGAFSVLFCFIWIIFTIHTGILVSLYCVFGLVFSSIQH